MELAEIILLLILTVIGLLGVLFVLLVGFHPKNDVEELESYGGTANYHFGDWIRAGKMLGYSVQWMTNLVRALSGKGPGTKMAWLGIFLILFSGMTILIYFVVS